MEGYRVYRKDRHGSQEEDVTLFVSDCLECREICHGTEEELTERLWVRRKGRAGTGHVILGVCYRVPTQEY